MTETRRSVSYLPASARDETLELIQAIRLALSSTNASARDDGLTNLLVRLMALDPSAVAQIAEMTPSNNGREEILRRVAQEWAVRNTSDALEWAVQLPDAEERQTALANVALQVAGQDPAQAVEIAEHYRIGGDILPSLAQQWAEQDFNSALDWAARQPAGDQRNQIMARLAFAQAQTSPDEAARLVLREIPAGHDQEEAAMSVLHQWALNDFAGASAWVTAFPESLLKERAVAELSGVVKYQAEANHSASAPAEDSY